MLGKFCIRQVFYRAIVRYVLYRTNATYILITVNIRHVLYNTIVYLGHSLYKAYLGDYHGTYLDYLLYRSNVGHIFYKAALGHSCIGQIRTKYVVYDQG